MYELSVTSEHLSCVGIINFEFNNIISMWITSNASVFKQRTLALYIINNIKPLLSDFRNLWALVRECLLCFWGEVVRRLRLCFHFYQKTFYLETLDYVGFIKSSVVRVSLIYCQNLPTRFGDKPGHVYMKNNTNW
jgi:hypothetical protein